MSITISNPQRDFFILRAPNLQIAEASSVSPSGELVCRSFIRRNQIYPRSQGRPVQYVAEEHVSFTYNYTFGMANLALEVQQLPLSRSRVQRYFRVGCGQEEISRPFTVSGERIVRMCSK